jgi:pimeloyl-ACP methyl ester carboxylesterase
MAIPVRVGLRHVGDLDLMIDDRGREDCPVIVIAVGFGEQLGSVEFPEEFADALCARNWRVVRFDHRDVGLSTGFDDQPVDLVEVMSRLGSGQPVEVPYTFVDMAEDVAGIIRSLGDDVAVRLVGVSMGGVIARWTAVRYPELIDSLVLVMTPFDVQPAAGMPGPDPAVAQQMFSKTIRRNRSDAIQATVDTWRSYAGSAFPFDEASTRRRVEFAHDRSYRPEALVRQLAAMVASPPISPHHGAITAPTRVVLGDSDPLVPSAHGTALAKAIPQADLQIIPGMGHELPPAAWPQLLDAVATWTDS